jgi:hypothetical protein
MVAFKIARGAAGGGTTLMSSIDRRLVAIVIVVPAAATLIALLLFQLVPAAWVAHLKEALAVGEAASGVIAAALGVGKILAELQRDAYEDELRKDGKLGADQTESGRSILEARYALGIALLVVGAFAVATGVGALPACGICGP